MAFDEGDAVVVRLPSGKELKATFVRMSGKRANVFVERYGQHRTYPLAWLRRVDS
jgi:hypothetical protein